MKHNFETTTGVTVSAFLMLLVSAIPVKAYAYVGDVPNGGFSEKQITCSNGNFKGEAVVRMHRRNVTVGSLSQQRWTAEILRYKITRFNGQSGGNKANVNLRLETWNWKSGNHRDHAWAKSPDAMRQDGQWHNLSMYREGANGDTTSYPPEMSQAEITVQFVFDKSGSDPNCETKTGRYHGEPRG